MSEPDGGGGGGGGGGNPSYKQHKDFAIPIGRELMDLDLDLDSSWPLDPNPFPSNPSSPFFLSFPAHSSNPNHLLPLSSSEHPSSPLWTFSDGADEISPDVSVSAFSGGFRLADCSRIMSCNTDSTLGNLAEGSDKKSLVPDSVGTPEEEEISDESCIIKERMTQALRYFKDSAEQHFLVQVWAPVKNGNHCVLTTSGQPFLLDPHSNRLLHYRTVSLMYLFSVDGESDGDLGLPGRVFRQKLPEWTPNVQYYSSKEYPRRNHALHYNVRGTLALPVFEPSGQSCVGVVELIMTSQKINYSSEVDKVCKALEAVNLKTSDILDHPNRQICNEGRQTALAEILEILTVVCETHKLPLAQTWVPCKHRSILAYGGGSKKSCTSFDGSCMGQVCMSTTDVAYYLVDAHMWGFRDACAEHHLQKGQGVAGRAFLSHRPCFSTDITKFSKTEYPLVHYARMFGLLSCLAICLRSSYTGSDEYILEFFLPSTCVDPKEINVLMESLLKTTGQCFRSLKVFPCNELLGEGSLEVVETNSSKIESDQTNYQTSPNRKTTPGIDDLEFGGLGNRENINPTLLEGLLVTKVDCQKNENKTLIDADGCQSTSSVFDNKSMKTCERRRGKTEKSISLEVIQQYFTGSLKDAAKSLGVCPTTMKRICRQHGISRWPSRKINKVNRSLSKLQRVIESVQGAEGAFNLVSLTSPLPVAVGSISWPLKSEGARQNLTEPKTSDLQAEKKIESPTQKTEGGITEGRLLVQSSFQGEVGKELFGSKTRSVSGEGSTGTPTSEDSCQGSPPDESHTNNLPVISSFQEQCLIMDRSFVPEPIEGPNLVAAYSTPDTLLTTEPQNLLGGMLIEDAGSCKDLIDLCNFSANSCQDDALCSEPPNLQAMPTFARTMPHATATQDMRTITIKATYKEDIIRFRISLASSVVELKEEVSKRLKLEVGTFDIKYLDDDHEWVLLVCDADLQECVELTKSSGRHMIRLLVHDILANLGSSCESSGE